MPMSRLGVGSAGAVRISADSVKRPSGAQVSLSSFVDTVRLGSGGGAGGSGVSALRLGSGGGDAASALKAGLSDVDASLIGAVDEHEAPALFCLQLDDDFTEMAPKRLMTSTAK